MCFLYPNNAIEVLVGNRCNDVTGQNILHLDGIAIPAVAVAVGDDEGEGAHVLAGVGGETDGVGPYAGVIAAVGLHLHFVSGGKFKAGECVRILGDDGHGAVHIEVPGRGVAVFGPTEGCEGGAEGVNSQHGGTLTRGQLFHAQADAVFLAYRIDGIAGRSRRVVVVVAIAI